MGKYFGPKFVCFYLTGAVTRITLASLAVADMGCLISNFITSVDPYTDPNWFQVYIRTAFTIIINLAVTSNFSILLSYFMSNYLFNKSDPFSVRLITN